VRGPDQEVGHAALPFPLSELSPEITSPGSAGIGDDAGGDSAGGLCDRLPRWVLEYFGMGSAVVLGQDLGESAWPVGDGAVADLAAGDWKAGNGHREAARR
jgi:hypothetical protein